MLALDKIYNLNCVDGLAFLDDSSISLTVTSPPYDALRTCYGYSFDFEPIARELFRVTKDSGVVVWVVGDACVKGSETGTSFRQALYFKEIGFNLHDTMLFAKANPLPQNQKRYEQAFEYMFVFTKGKIGTFNPLKEPCKLAGQPHRGSQRKINGEMKQKTGNGRPIKDDKVKSNIWTYPVTGEREAGSHPAVFPERLAHDHIISWSNEGDIVLDVFSGSGSTAAAAQKLGRHFIGMEISQEYCEISERRLAGQGHFNTDIFVLQN